MDILSKYKLDSVSASYSAGRSGWGGSTLRGSEGGREADPSGQ